MTRSIALHTFTIDKIVPGGAGLAQHEGGIVFVPGALPGEGVEGRIIRRKQGYSFAKIERIVTASPDRVAPHCPEHPECGGCPWGSFSYEAQLAAKEEILREALARTAGLAEVAVDPVSPAPSPLGYRTRAQLKVQRARQGVRLGFFREGTHIVHPVARCPVLVPSLSGLIQPLTELLGAGADRFAGLREVHMMAGEEPSEPLVALDLDWCDPGAVKRLHGALRGKGTPAHLVARVRKGRRRHVFGQEWISIHVDDLVLRASDESFTQSNAEMNRRLVAAVIGEIGKTPASRARIFDLYAGIGNFALPIARRFGESRVFGVEENPAAVRDARENAGRAGLSERVRFLEGSVETGLALLDEAGEKADLVVLDPPRTGAGRTAIRRILGFCPGGVLYVSCNPVTLARDLKALVEGGYRVARITPSDFFPQTPHVETLAVLTR